MVGRRKEGKRRKTRSRRADVQENVSAAPSEEGAVSHMATKAEAAPVEGSPAQDLNSLTPNRSDRLALGDPFRVSEPTPDDQSRTWLVRTLSWLFVFLVVAPFIVIVAGWTTFDELEPFYKTTFGAVVGLLGPVAGYYFGSRR